MDSEGSEGLQAGRSFGQGIWVPGDLAGARWVVCLRPGAEVR